MKPSKSWNHLTTTGRMRTIRGDVRFSSITWLPYPDLGLAIGPSVVDARTGDPVREHRLRRGLDPGLHGELARRGVDRPRPVRAARPRPATLMVVTTTATAMITTTATATTHIDTATGRRMKC